MDDKLEGRKRRWRRREVWSAWVDQFSPISLTIFVCSHCTHLQMGTLRSVRNCCCCCCCWVRLTAGTWTATANDLDRAQFYWQSHIWHWHIGAFGLLCRNRLIGWSDRQLENGRRMCAELMVMMMMIMAEGLWWPASHQQLARTKVK